MKPIHQATIGSRQLNWAVDPAALATVASWPARNPAALHQDLEGMASMFPHWILAGALHGKLARCTACATPLVPTDGRLRCFSCGSPGAANGLLWLGQIPALARPEPAFCARQAALREAGFGEVASGNQAYLLVPLTVLYPAEWPQQEPQVRYTPRWLTLLGLPTSSARHHLVSSGQACIYAARQWTAQPIHAVLGQRMLNHIASLFKVVAGQTPEQAFIGRIHHIAWQPDPPEAA